MIYLGALATVLVIAMIVFIAGWVYPRVAPDDAVELGLDVPSVAPGVAVGTKLIMHGAEVGEVTSLDKVQAGVVRVGVSMQPEKIEGLTDSFDVDFRPQNYFGVTAVNVIARPGGQDLKDGRVLSRVPAGDFTMSTMLEKGSLVIDGTLTDPMIQTLDKIIRYTDGLTPMIEAGVVFTNQAARAQQAMPSHLMGRVNDVLAVLPAFNDQAIVTLNTLYQTKFNKRPDGSYGVDDAFMDETDEAMDIMSVDVFGGAGKLLASHGTELTPVTTIIEVLSDAMPGLLSGGAVGKDMQMLVDRYNAAFSTSGDRKILNLRIVLDDLPGVAAPLAAAGVSTQAAQEGPR
ncbi:Mce family protein [Nocardia neocaledoniensis]|uniref:Mce family protein n=1 Tax=Nocardia neocaledoniensis TaxID=236511 RepID=UPI002453E0CE|nr:Mce family protein [Nocardia neocaledoniensis]